ncbi:Hsp33 family molecular chaperone HslO [[Mycoplasma] mobile]|uniref:Hsp33 disulfide bond chaperone n=1 Tax=Mycoplasma mobile (strain ATCC 43663 / 163K / NCTC 11711) TaxID=267748 RepID=Q6KHH2_MYCM1|nr:Hsp33 family molecular chaperone HslO [[Mycoplasma] mobile]AAT27958.1 Hsp33 disulfide bond chaperone [Mycoplasma mobile 163K]
MEKNIHIYSKNNFRIFTINSKNIINEFLSIHKPNAFNSLVYANIINAFPILNSVFSDEDIKVIYKLKTSGAVNNAIVEVQDGIFRALINNELDVKKEDINLNKIDFEKVIGKGVLTITKTQNNNSYSSQIELQHSTFIESINHFLLQSEQLYSACVWVLNFDEKDFHKVTRAELVLMQKMPQATENDIVFFEKFIKENVLKNSSLEEYISKLGAKKVDSKFVKSGCFCSIEKMKKVLENISYQELNKIFKENKNKIEIVCQFCKIEYEFSKEDFEKNKN